MQDTIKSPREIEHIFSVGRRVVTACCVALVTPTPEGRSERGRVAFVAGRKLGSAVRRNRAKRVLREAVRRAGGPWSGLDIVFVAREGALRASPAELDEALRSIIARVGIGGGGR